MQNQSTAFDPLAADAAQLLRTAGDDDLLSLIEDIEAHGRRIDALRVTAAAEVADRSRRELQSAALSAKKGCRNASELMQRVSGASGRTVEVWLRLGKRLRGRTTLIGVDGPADFPAVARALIEGRLGIDKACAIVSVLTPALTAVSLDTVAIAESALVQDAPDFTADEVRIQAMVWHTAIDPDGIEASEERAMASRGIRLGRVRDGIVPISGNLMPEVAGTLKRLFDACLSPRSAPAFLSDQELRDQELSDQEQSDQELSDQEQSDQPGGGDSRTPDQQRHDVFASLIDAASRAADAPSIGGAAPTVLVSVRADDLERGRGAGYIDGVDAPISLRAVKQYVCAGGTQRVVIDDAGRIIELGSPQRTFTPQQRRAISVRDGGCIIPGCSVPAAWCEIHHVLPDRDGGPTHTDNGVLLCWFHHRTIDTAGWQVRMSRGSPQVKAPPWIDRHAPWRPATKSRTRMTDGIDRPPW